MDLASAFLPQDRRRALAEGTALPAWADGALLFADISGFTPLTELLAQRFGSQRGAELLTRELNRVYNALIGEVERWGGSVIGFSGDAITCWFVEDEIQGAAHRATAAAFAMQQAMAPFASFEVATGTRAALAIKAAVAAGAVLRCLVGDPNIQRIDVVAGATLDRMAAIEAVTHRGEVAVDETTLSLLGTQATVLERRAIAGVVSASVLSGFQAGGPPVSPPAPVLDETRVRPWLLAAIYHRLAAEQGRFLAELRPAAALFLQFGGLDFEHDPAAGSKLDDFVRWVQHVLVRYAGTLIQLTTGDKGSYLYAAFGAPLAHDDDTARAAAAALELCSPPDHLAVGNVRIGISQGTMRVGPYGSSGRLTYGVLGDATNLAARLMTQAQSGQVLASEATAALIETQFVLTPLGARQLKGKSQPQIVYAVAGMRQRSLRQLAELYPNPPVGRVAEIEQGTLLLDQVQQGASLTLRIEGEPGTGKSHLAAYLADRAEARGFVVAYGACQNTQQTAYSALRSPLRRLLGLDDSPASEAATQIAQMEAALVAIAPAWRVRLPLLGDLFGLPIPDNTTTAAFEPRLRREALANLVGDLFQRAAMQRPQLLLIEDVHWADEATQALVLALARMQRSGTLLLLVHRPALAGDDGFLAELAAIPRQHGLHLNELDNAATHTFLQAQLQGPVDTLAVAFIYAQTQGNPFFSEELADALRERGQLIQEDGEWTLSPRLLQSLQEAQCLLRTPDGWQLAPDAALGTLNLGIPNSVHGLVLARFDRLPEDAKLTLKVASVIGREFSTRLLAAAHPATPDAALLDAQIELFLQRDFARVQVNQPAPAYLFKHSITQEAVYQTLLELQRQELHYAVAKGMEAQQSDAVEVLAHHYWHSDLTLAHVRAKAEEYVDAAAWRAMRGSANATALAYFDRLLQLEMRPAWLLGRIEVLHILGRRMREEASLLALDTYAPENDLALQLERAVRWSEYYAVLGDYELANHWLTQGRTAAEAGGDWANVARCLTRAGLIAWRQGDYAAASDAYDNALALVARVPGLDDTESEARYGLGLVYRQRGRFDEARTLFAADLAANQARGNRLREASALNALGAIANLERDYASAVQRFQQALELRETIGDRAGVGISLMSLAQVYGNLGDYSRVEPLLHQALTIHQDVRNRWDEMLVLNELGILYTTVGQYARAFAVFERGLELSSALESETGAAYILCNLGQAQRDAGHLQAGIATFDRGLVLATAQEDPNLQAIYLSDRALAHVQVHAFEVAESDARQALDRFTALEQPLSTTTLHCTLAAAHLGLGRRLEAAAAAHSALALLDECGGEGPDFPQRDYWLAGKVLEELGEADAAKHAFRRAAALLVARADRISDAAMRRSYLVEVAIHAAIMHRAPSP